VYIGGRSERPRQQSPQFSMEKETMKNSLVCIAGIVAGPFGTTANIHRRPPAATPVRFSAQRTIASRVGSKSESTCRRYIGVYMSEIDATREGHQQA